MNGDYQTFTISDGERFYVRFKDDDFVITEVKERKSYSGLCGNYSELLQQAINEQLRIKESVSFSMAEEGSEDSGMESASLSVSENEEATAQSSLWVEKFRPRSYVQLLSDDGTNRTLLKWLKLWDKLVFGRELAKVQISIDDE